MVSVTKNAFLFLSLSLSLSFFLSLGLAQETASSLTDKETAIRSQLIPKLDALLVRDKYVLEVSVSGTPAQTNNPNSALPGLIATDEELPGFERVENLPISALNSNQASWEIRRIDIDLIAYHEVTEEQQNYIREIVNVIAGLNATRGDQFNFRVIIPSKEEPAEPTEPLFIKWLPWIGGISIALLFLMLLLWFILRKFKTAERSLQDFKRDLGVEDSRPNQAPKSAGTQQPGQAAGPAVRRSPLDPKNQWVQDKNQQLLQDIVTMTFGYPERTGRMVKELAENKQGIQQLTELARILGNHTSQKILSPNLNREVYEKISQEAEQSTPNHDHALTALQQIRNLLLSYVSSESQEQNTFAFLQNLQPSEIHWLIKDEPPSVKALVISTLDEEIANEVLYKATLEQRTQIIVHMGKLEEAPLELSKQIAGKLALKIREWPTGDAIGVDGKFIAANLLAQSDKQAREKLLNEVRIADQGVSQAIEKNMFVFDSLVWIPKATLTDIVRRMPAEDALAMISDADPKVQSAVVQCFPENLRATLFRTLKAKNFNLQVVAKQKREFTKKVQSAAQQGKISLEELNQKLNSNTPDPTANNPKDRPEDRPEETT